MAVKKKTGAKKTTKKVVKAKKPVAKKTTAKKVVKKATKTTTKTTAKAKTTKSSSTLPVAKKISVGKKPFSKSDLVGTLSEQCGVARKQASHMLEILGKVIEAHLQKGGPEIFNLAGLMKLKVVNKPATKARKGTNPFTGEPMMFKAKPASKKVKILPLKALKGMV